MKTNPILHAINDAPEVTAAAVADPSIESQAPDAYPELPHVALHGPAGEVALLATRKSEAGIASVLLTVLTCMAAMFGSAPHVGIGETKHAPRLFAVLVGASSRARKGTSTDPVLRILKAVEEALSKKGLLESALKVSHGPLSTGEGLVQHLRDASEEQDRSTGLPVDPGVEDKRMWVIEGEFGAPLQAAKREGNTLSASLRTAWDSGNIAPLTKSNRIKVTGAHVCIIGHITHTELQALLTNSDIHNGFANRILWCCARRPKLEPFPEPMPEEDVQAIADRLATAVATARHVQRVELADDTKQAWGVVYPQLSKDVPGVLGAVTSRAEAQVIRLALIYALLDGESQVSLTHLQAALAVWSYCYQSARYLFGNTEADPVANRILSALAGGELTTTQVNALFNGHVGTKKLKEVLTTLEATGRVAQRKDGGGRGKGKATTFWRLTSTFIASAAGFAELEEMS